MQAVILAAGEGRRLRPLTEDVPKALIPMKGKYLIEYALQSLPPCVEEVLIVTGYRGSDIESALGQVYQSLPLSYVKQREKKGTAGALWSAQRFLKKGYFLVLNGDDIYHKDDVAPFCVEEFAFGYTKTEARGKMLSAIIKENHFYGFTRPHSGDAICLGTNVFTLDHRIFNQDLVLLPSGEYGLPQTLALIAQSEPVRAHHFHSWFPINTEEDITRYQNL